MPNQDIINEYVENNPKKLGGDSGCFAYQDVLAIAKTILNASGPGKEYATLKFLQKYCDICGDKNAADFTEFQHGDPRNYGKLLNVKNNWEFSHGGRGVAAVKSDNTNNQQSRNEEDCNLTALISKIRTAIKEQRLKTELQNIIHQLSILGYEYDFDTFPPLENKDKFNTDIGDSPKSIAEALLWKLGRWKVYSNFVAYYQDDNIESSDADVVFHAFARHLKEDKPIFDQHTLRSMWIVDDRLSDDDRSHCKKYLMNSKGNWKQSGSGASGAKCYELYVRFVEELVSNNSGLTNDNIDKLFMPLGQALKKTTRNYEQVKRYFADQSTER